MPSCRLTASRHVSLVEQELLTLLQHMSSPPVLSRVRVFCVLFCRSLFVLFLSAIVLSVLRYKDSDYPFDIFKRFVLITYNT